MLYNIFIIKCFFLSYKVRHILYTCICLFFSAGEPFLHPVSTHVIPANQSYLRIETFDVTKTYSINLLVFEQENGHTPVIDQQILYVPDDGKFLKITGD